MAADPSLPKSSLRVWQFLAGHQQTIANVAILIVVYVYLGSFFPASLVLADTTTTGGDTSSHFGIAALFSEHFLSQGDVVRWSPGNYGGFPSFILYFPFLFILMALTSLGIPFTISFKLYSMLGVFLLPVCSFWFLKSCRLRFPGPALGATGSVLFLLNESNSMWGGNILSALAGQFSFGFSFALTFVCLGALFSEMRRLVSPRAGAAGLSVGDVGRSLFLIACVFLIGFSHIFTLMVCVLASTFFLLDRRHFASKALLTFWVFAVGGLLFSGWFVQLFANMPFTTSFTIRWAFTSTEEVLPRQLWLPVALFVPASLYACVPRRFRIQRLSSWERHAFAFAWYVIAVCGVCFLAADGLSVPDIRFLPFIHYLVAVFGAGYLAVAIPKKFPNTLTAAALSLGLLLWSDHFPSQVDGWVRWNYSGFESKPGWPTFREINEYLKGTLGDPRVAYEHTPDNNGQFGTIRAFEDLPHFANRATLEGLHFQMSLLSPFVFYTQSLYSKLIACPFREYPCSSIDYARAHEHLQLLNVRELILISPETKERAGEHEGYEFVRRIGNSPYEIWKVVHPYGYVTPLKRDPEFIEEENFRLRFYQWYRTYEPGLRFLYTRPRANSLLTGVGRIPRSPRPEMDRVYEVTDCGIEEEIRDEKIRFRTSCLNQPHLVKVSYHPGWSLTGGVGPYLISPAFMLVYPTENEVTLEWTNARPKALGAALNLLGIVLLLGTAWLAWPGLRGEKARWRAIRGLGWLERQWLNRVGHAAFVLLVISFAIRIGFVIAEPSYDDMLHEAQQYFAEEDFEEAQRAFAAVAERWPDQPRLDLVYYFWAMAHLRGDECPEAAPVLETLLERFPGSGFIAEAHYSLGICAERTGQFEEARRRYRYVVDTLRHPIWSQHSRARLEQLTPPSG